MNIIHKPDASHLRRFTVAFLMSLINFNWDKYRFLSSPAPFYPWYQKLLPDSPMAYLLTPFMSLLNGEEKLLVLNQKTEKTNPSYSFVQCFWETKTRELSLSGLKCYFYYFCYCAFIIHSISCIFKRLFFYCFLLDNEYIKSNNYKRCVNLKNNSTLNTHIFNIQFVIFSFSF